MKSFSQFIAEAARIVGRVDLGPPRKSKESEGLVTKGDLNGLEKYLDSLFAHYNIDIDFTRHFLDRANDPRNGKPINIEELRKIFKDTYQKHGSKLANLKDIEAVLEDLSTKINVPFALKWDAKSKELDLVAKTVMRKKDFKTPDRKFKV